MKNYLFTIAALLMVVCANAQQHSDTTYSYIDTLGKVCDVQDAVFKAVVFKTGKLWHKQLFTVSDNDLRYDYVYSDEELKTLEDTSRLYFPYNTGMFEQIYKQGKMIKLQLIDKDKRLVCYVIYGKNGDVVEQKGFDKKGKEIPNYIFMQEASFPGGPEAWAEYIKMNLNKNIPVINGAPIGTYRVVVSFLIDKEGNISEVKVLNDPGYGTAQEAVRVISSSPKWNPAIQSNEHVTYRQKQAINFSVSK
jgi:hypothetical protein